MKLLISILALSMPLVAQSNERQSLSTEDFKKVENVYVNCILKIKPSSSSHADKYSTRLSPEQVKLKFDNSTCKELIVINGSILLFLDQKDFKIQRLNNLPVWDYLESDLGKSAENRQKIPTLGYESAVAVARSHLKQFGIEIPKGYLISRIGFDESFHSRWEVRWQPTYKNIPYDNGEGFRYPYAISITFSEKDGVVGIGNTISLPTPKSDEAKVEAEAAIIKASKCAPLVMESSFYRQGREPGFAIKSVKEVKLVVNTPNWLLDPKRAIWISKEPPQEARVAWKVVFSTVDTQAKDRGSDSKGNLMKLIPPDIIIFIDAATGECIGANFT